MNRRKRTLLILLAFLTLLIGLPMWKVWRMVGQERLNKALIAAIKRQNTEAAVSALEAGADPNVRDDGKQAVSFGEMLQRFLASLHGGQRPTPNSSEEAPLGQTRPTPLILLLAVPAGDTTLVRDNLPLLKALLKYGADPNSGDENGTTPLHWAVRLRLTESARLLLEHHADPNAMGGEPYAGAFKFAPLHLADPACARLLLAHGAQTEITDWRGATPLLADCTLGNNAETVPILLEHGANVNARDNDGNTPLLNAVDGPSLSTIKALLAKGADLKARTKYGQTALMLAAESGDKETVRFLLQQGLDVNARNNGGATALLRSQDISIDKLLLEKGADPNLPGRIGDERVFVRTPLMNAAEDGDTARMQQLLKYGAAINARNKDGDTALKIALDRREATAIRFLKRQGAVR